MVLPNFFEAMRVPLRAGRYLSDRDTQGTPGVAVINEIMARKYHRGGNPIGRRFKQGVADSPLPSKEIVGVVADVKQYTLDEETRPAVYQPVLQPDTGVIVSIYRSLSYVVHARMAPANLAASIRTGVRSVDPKLVELNVRPMDTIVGNTSVALNFRDALTRVLRALLFDTSPLDGVTFAASAAVLLLIAGLSSYLPARRAH